MLPKPSFVPPCLACLRTARVARAAAVAFGLSLAQGAAALTGVCPDGSIFIVQHESQIPCKDAKQVEPSEVPPIRPEYLPTPYTWKVYNEAQDPNNPYNLIDAAREVRALREANEARQRQEQQAAQAGATRGTAPADPVQPLDLGVDEGELRDLYQVVELSQAATPASFERETADGRGVFEVRLARSRAFEARLDQAWRSRGGLPRSGALVFTALSKRPERFHANLTFVQGHLSFQPDASNARQLGILQGRLGELEGGELVLGYVVLPEAMDLAQPMDVYWNDRRIEVQFVR